MKKLILSTMLIVVTFVLVLMMGHDDGKVSFALFANAVTCVLSFGFACGLLGVHDRAPYFGLPVSPVAELGTYTVVTVSSIHFAFTLLVWVNRWCVA